MKFWKYKKIAFFINLIIIILINIKGIKNMGLEIKESIGDINLQENFSSRILSTIYRDESFVGGILNILNGNNLNPSSLQEKLSKAREEYRKTI